MLEDCASMSLTWHTACEPTALISVIPAVEAEANARLASDTHLCSTAAADQSAFPAAGQTDGQLLLTQSGTSGDAVLSAPEHSQVIRPTPAGQYTALEALKDHNHSEALAAQESMQQHPTASGPSKAGLPGSDATCVPACNSVSVGPAKSTSELSHQAQQETQQDHDGTSCPDSTGVVVAVAASHDAQQQQPESSAVAAQRQDSSSMVSLSPSLKLDIPGLDDILSSDLLTEDDGHATSQLQPHLQQVSLHDPHHGSDCQDQLRQQQQQEQQSVEQQQFADQPQQQHQQQQQQQQLIDQQEAQTEKQQEFAEHGAYPAGPQASKGTSDAHDALQSSSHAPAHSEPSSLDASTKSQAGVGGSSDQGMPCQQAEVETTGRPFHARSDTTALADSVADSAVPARQHSLAAGSQGASAAVLQSPPRHAAWHARQGASAAEQAAPLPALADTSAQSAAAETADEAAKDAADVRPHRRSTASHPTLEASMTARASSPLSSQHVPLTNHDGMRLQANAHEPQQVLTTDASGAEQVLAATDVHTESAAHRALSAAEQTTTDKQPQRLQQTRMTGSQQVC